MTITPVRVFRANGSKIGWFTDVADSHHRAPGSYPVPMCRPDLSVLRTRPGRAAAEPDGAQSLTQSRILPGDPRCNLSPNEDTSWLLAQKPRASTDIASRALLRMGPQKGAAGRQCARLTRPRSRSIGLHCDRECLARRCWRATGVTREVVVATAVRWRRRNGRARTARGAIACAACATGCFYFPRDHGHSKLREC
jgi:hypothetical protein